MVTKKKKLIKMMSVASTSDEVARALQLLESEGPVSDELRARVHRMGSVEIRVMTRNLELHSKKETK